MSNPGHHSYSFVSEGAVIVKLSVNKKINNVSVGDILSEPIIDNQGNVLLNKNVSLTEKHIERICDQNIETINIFVTQKHTPDELHKFKVKTLEEMKEKFELFENGKKKNALIKMFLVYKMSKYNE